MIPLLRSTSLVKVVYPLKQGLKQIGRGSYKRGISNRVKVVYPLKQGLKPFWKKMFGLKQGAVKVVYPLKQGLKLLLFFYNSS